MFDVLQKTILSCWENKNIYVRTCLSLIFQVLSFSWDDHHKEWVCQINVWHDEILSSKLSNVIFRGNFTVICHIKCESKNIQVWKVRHKDNKTVNYFDKKPQFICYSLAEGHVAGWVIFAEQLSAHYSYFRIILNFTRITTIINENMFQELLLKEVFIPMFHSIVIFYERKESWILKVYHTPCWTNSRILVFSIIAMKFTERITRMVLF